MAGAATNNPIAIIATNIINFFNPAPPSSESFPLLRHSSTDLSHCQRLNADCFTFINNF
jgi:hypothetical protein